MTYRSKKKLLIITDEYPPALGGAGTVASLLRKQLSEHYDVALFSASGNNEDADYYIDKRRLLWPLQYLIMFIRIGLNKFDFIILNDGPAQYAFAFYIIRPKVKVLTFIHGVEKLVLRPTLFSRLLGYRFFLNFTYKRSSRVIAVSDFISGRAKASFPCLRKNIVTVHNPVEFPVRARVNNKYRLLSVSRIERGKGYDRMLSVFNILHSRDSRWRWTIVGSGSYLTEFRRKCEENGLAEVVSFTGPIPHASLPDIYNSNSVFLLLSDLEESFGLTYLEAVSCGIPSIAYSRCGPLEVTGAVSGCVAVNYESTDKDIAIQIEAVDSSDTILTDGLEKFSVDRYLNNIIRVLHDA